MLSDAQQKALVEACLFLSTQPLSLSQLVKKLRRGIRLSGSGDQNGNLAGEEMADIKEALNEARLQGLESFAAVDFSVETGITAADVRRILSEIAADLEREDRGLELVTVAKGYQIRTKLAVAELLREEKLAAPTRFSSSSLETLAIVAYQQPVTRQKIEGIRGVDCGGVIKTLLDKNILRVVGRSDEPGKPLIYGTTNKFLEIFGLKGLSDLPSLKDYESLQMSAGESLLVRASAGDSGEGHIHINDLLDDRGDEIVLEDEVLIEDLDAKLAELKSVEKGVFSVDQTEVTDEVGGEETGNATGTDSEGHSG